jgi:hypothetical protein
MQWRRGSAALHQGPACYSGQTRNGIKGFRRIHLLLNRKRNWHLQSLFHDGHADEKLNAVVEPGDSGL